MLPPNDPTILSRLTERGDEPVTVEFIADEPVTAAELYRYIKDNVGRLREISGSIAQHFKVKSRMGNFAFGHFLESSKSDRNPVLTRSKKLGDVTNPLESIIDDTAGTDGDFEYNPHNVAPHLREDQSDDNEPQPPQQ